MFSNKLSSRTSELCLLAIVILMYIAVCAEADIYVPAFPEMVQYFGTTEDKIQLILSLNFLGICVASLICGPLSDAFGRRKILLSGLLLFFVSSVACVFAESFNVMLFWRVIQGFSASIPMVLGCALFLDKYELNKASQLVGILNSVITAAMAGAPILGAWLTYHFHWRLNFVTIAIVVLLSLLGTFFFIEESLPEEKRKKFDMTAILKDYIALASSFKFVGYTLMALLPFIGIVVYISNLSLIFINHLNVPADTFAYYQATTMGTFVIFSALSSKLIAAKGIEFTKIAGSLGVLAGGIALLCTALFAPHSAALISLSMSLFAAGGSMVVGIFGMKAMALFPEMKGTSSSMMTAIRQFVAASLVFISEVTFDGSIVPVTMIIVGSVCMLGLWYFWIETVHTKKSLMT